MREDLKKIILLLCNEYREEMTVERVTLWEQLLKDYSIPAIKQAAIEHIKESQFFPKISELLKQLKAGSVNNQALLPPQQSDQSDWLTELFLAFSIAYPRHWKPDQSSPMMISAHRALWEHALQGFTPEQIREGREICIKTVEFPPSIAEFRTILEDARKLKRDRDFQRPIYHLTQKDTSARFNAMTKMSEIFKKRGIDLKWAKTEQD